MYAILNSISNYTIFISKQYKIILKMHAIFQDFYMVYVKLAVARFLLL